MTDLHRIILLVELATMALGVGLVLASGWFPYNSRQQQVVSAIGGNLAAFGLLTLILTYGILVIFGVVPGPFSTIVMP